MPDQGLNVVALISGGKDSFFSLLHCIRHGHRVVALANLFPATEGASTEVQVIDPSVTSTSGATDATDGDSDLNSFMYQTVGHEVIPLYAAATGLPLYRQPICGGAEHHERDYAFDAADDTAAAGKSADETESMTTLLRAVMDRHPEANAVSAGAILSTYQRTRVESVALRLGLTPLAFLWKYPTLPPPCTPADDAQLLKDMAAAGLEARIIKVASAGLGEDHLWECVSSTAGAERVKAALRRFGSSGGAVLGEGGEFETLVLDGPSRLFKRRISVPPEGRRPIQEGGGTTWLMLRDAVVQDKDQGSSEITVRTPDIFDARFQSIMDELSNPPSAPQLGLGESSAVLGKVLPSTTDAGCLLQWAVMADRDADCSTIEAETAHVVDKIRDLLASHSLEANHVSNTVIILRRMSDFPKINTQYGKLFSKANPPSRVTVSCGDLLPYGSSIAIYLTVDATLPPSAERHGLHVQSRSYWAPANIGPYSQAVGIPISTPAGVTGLRSWSVAGQIPLIPSSMALPPPSETSQQMQIVLSLQHLWRIGVDVNIQFWTSAVAFFARSTSDAAMQRNAEMAGQAWRLAHGSPDDLDDDNNGPDPWDLKFNPRYMSLGTAGTHAKETPLPDWEIMTLHQQNEPDTCIPPVFAVEVEELPRQSAVEWHAHVGLSQVEEGSVETLHIPQLEGAGGWKVWHVVARGQDGVFLHTVLARDLDVAGGSLGLENIKQETNTTYREALRAIKIEGASSTAESAPYLTYIDAVNVQNPETEKNEERGATLALVPCRSIWSSAGKRLGVISLYRAVLRP
ncbi:hypothetical protein ACO1O0_000906 [Amphichorda felina]